LPNKTSPKGETESNFKKTLCSQTSSPGVGLNSSFDDESGESLNGGPLFDENEEYQEKVTQKEVLNKRRNALVENDINKEDKIRIDELKKVTHTQILTVKCVSNDSEGEGFATPASTSDEDSSVRMPKVHQIDKNNNEINAAKPPPGFENIKPNLQVGSKLDLNDISEQNHVIDTFTNFEARERKIPDHFDKYPIPGQVQTLSHLSKINVKSSTKLVSPKKIPKINDDEKSLSSQFSDDSELCFKKTAVIENSRSKGSGEVDSFGSDISIPYTFASTQNKIDSSKRNKLKKDVFKTDISTSDVANPEIIKPDFVKSKNSKLSEHNRVVKSASGTASAYTSASAFQCQCRVSGKIQH